MNYKGSVDAVSGKVSQEVKVQFPFKNYYVWFGSKSGNLKVHVDLGEFDFVKKMRLYANARFTKDAVPT
jgi:hypothetical protein